MKRNLLMLTLITSVFASYAQKNKSKEEFFMFKPDWKPTSKAEDAAYFIRLQKVSDSCWRWDTYRFNGPMISSEQSKNKEQPEKHGTQVYYKPSGYMDSSGMAIDGAPNGDWTYFSDSGRAVTRKTYDRGILVSETDLTKNNDTASQKSNADERESVFPGGINKWSQYLSKNMQYPDRALKARVMGDVIAHFTVDTLGNVGNVEIFKSVEFSLDQETIRLITKSPKWTPASKNGKPVKSYKRQPIRFRFS